MKLRSTHSKMNHLHFNQRRDWME